MPRKKELTEEQKKEIELLRSNNKMYEDTIKEAEVRGGSEKTIQRIKTAKADIEEKLRQFGENPDEVKEEATASEDEIINIINSNSNDEVNIYKPDEVEDVEVIDESARRDTLGQPHLELRSDARHLLLVALVASHDVLVTRKTHAGV